MEVRFADFWFQKIQDDPSEAQIRLANLNFDYHQENEAAEEARLLAEAKAVEEAGLSTEAKAEAEEREREAAAAAKARAEAEERGGGGGGDEGEADGSGGSKAAELPLSAETLKSLVLKKVIFFLFMRLEPPEGCFFSWN